MQTSAGLLHHEQLSQEFRALTNYDGPLQAQGGIYLFYENAGDINWVVGSFINFADDVAYFWYLGGFEPDATSLGLGKIAIGHGIRTKLVNNYLAVISCQMNAEVLTLSNAYGLDLETTLDVIHGTSATNGQLKLNFATKVLVGDTEPGFRIDLAHKDLTLIVNSANASKVSVPIAAAARESLSLARSTPYHAKDFSALLDFWCERAGLNKVRFKTQGKA